MSFGKPQPVTLAPSPPVFRLAILLALLGGDPVSARGAELANRPVFSSNSKTVAFTWTKTSRSRRIHPDIAYLRWCDVTRPEQQKSVRIVQVDRDFKGGNLFECIHKVFSPDSRHLAVASPAGLDIVDLASAEKQRLTQAGETVSALCWAGNDKVIYVAHCHRRGPYQRISDRTFWEQRIGARPDARRAIYTEKGVATRLQLFMWQVESFSPDGRYAIFREEAKGAPFKLLNLACGTVKELPRRQSDGSAGVAWKPDGSAAVCIDFGVPGYTAFLVKPQTSQVWEFGKKFTDAFVDKENRRRRSSDLPNLRYLAWTADGRYLIVNRSDSGGHLLRLCPWSVLDLGRRFGWVFARSEIVVSSLAALPVGGWVGAWGPEGKWYAVDYAGTRFHRLVGPRQSGTIPTAGPPRPVGRRTGVLHTGTYGWPESRAMSPDGKYSVEVHPFRKVTLHRVKLPALRSATQPSWPKAEK